MAENVKSVANGAQKKRIVGGKLRSSGKATTTLPRTAGRCRQMTLMPSKDEFAAIKTGYSTNPSRSLSLRAEAYTDPRWFNVDLQQVIGRTWQWVCHIEKVREPG